MYLGSNFNSRTELIQLEFSQKRRYQSLADRQTEILALKFCGGDFVLLVKEGTDSFISMNVNHLFKGSFVHLFN